MFFSTLASGGDGGILASAHLRTDLFIEVFNQLQSNDHQGALMVWRTLEPTIRLMFREANPMPVKYWLWRQGLIHSPECRLPLSRISDSLVREIDLLTHDRNPRVLVGSPELARA